MVSKTNRDMRFCRYRNRLSFHAALTPIQSKGCRTLNSDYGYLTEAPNAVAGAAPGTVGHASSLPCPIDAFSLSVAVCAFCTSIPILAEIIKKGSELARQAQVRSNGCARVPLRCGTARCEHAVAARDDRVDSALALYFGAACSNGEVEYAAQGLAGRDFE